MTDNPETRQAPFFTLSSHSVLELAGRDAVSFAQSQFMNDVTALASGQWQWNGWLTPKGRVVALFALLRLDEERLWLLLADTDAEAMATALRRFVFRSRLSLAPRPDAWAEGAFATPAVARGAAIASVEGAAELDLGTTALPRALRIHVGGNAPAADAAAVAAWRAFDLRGGLPRLSPGEVERWTPQQLSLDRLRAYSVKKGCYPGQEIVARTHFLGQAKRGLALFEAQAEVATGATIEAGGEAWGSVVSTVESDGRVLALGVGSLERQAHDARCGDVALEPVPFLDGLAR